MRGFTVTLADGASVWENNGRVYHRYNAKVKVAGDSVKVSFYEKGITCGYFKNRLDGEEKERARAEYDPEQRFEKTGRNARRRLYDYVAANLHKHRDHNGKRQSFKLITLTFREDVKKLEEANQHFKKFIQRLNYHFTNDQFLRYVAVPELQMENNRYVWHYHVLFFNLPFLPVSGQIVDRLVAQGALAKDYDKRDTLFYIWGQGGVDACQVNFSDSYDVASYLSKYIGKGLEGVYEYAAEEKILHKKRFLHSKGLQGPKMMIAFLNKAQRQSILQYFIAHAKNFKRKGELGKYFETWCADVDFIGRVFGMDFRAGQTHINKLESVFEQYSYGFA